MIALFSLEAIQSKPAVFDVTKLEWMNGQYLSKLPAAELEPAVRRQLERLGVATGVRDLVPVIDAAKQRSRTVVQLAEQVAIRLDASRIVLDDKAEKLRVKMGGGFHAALSVALETLAPLDGTAWTSEQLLESLKGAAESRGLKLGDALQPIRVVLTGTTVSEPVNELLAVVGRDESLARLERALAGR
jgi:glutamyl-tRNA synthetase